MYMPEDIGRDEPAPEGGFTLIPAGTVAEAECIMAEERTSSGGKPQMQLTWRIIGHEFKNRRIWDDLCFVDGRKTRSKAVCATLGIVLSAEAALLPSAFVGKRAVITIVQDTYKGKTKNKVAFDGVAPAAPADGSPVTPDADEAQEEIPF